MSDECRKCKTTEGIQKVEILGRLVVLCEKCFIESMPQPNTAAILEHYFTTPMEDKGKALDEAVAYGYTQPWDMTLVAWTHQNDAGHHCFTISYVSKASNKSITLNVDKMD